MKDLRNLFLFGVPTAAVIAFLAWFSTVRTLPTWVLPTVAILAVVVLPLALTVALTKRKGDAKQP